MNVLLVHNEYGKPSGEDAVVAHTDRLLREHGHEVTLFVRRSADILKMRFGRSRAFVSGIYSLSSANAVRHILQAGHTDIVHIHNVFPQISPSVLPVCQTMGVPVVMTVHNYRLICPSGLHFRGGQICEKCTKGREYWCIAQNCEGNLFKSAGYALRNYVARKQGMFRENVTVFACLTQFQRQRLVMERFAPDRIEVLPNMANNTHHHNGLWTGDFVGFVGRVSPEKSIASLITAARYCPDIPFKVAGGCERMANFPGELPPNLKFLGWLGKEELDDFYRRSRLVVLCSTWFEGFPMTLVEAMSSAKPVVCSRIGGLPEIVDDGVTGMLFEPGNARDLTEKILYLWHLPDLCRKMGQAGREKALREYSSEKYYERLMVVYEKAIELGPGGPNHNS